MTTDEIVSLWPFCYHVTFASNLASIRKTGVIRPAAELLEAAGVGRPQGRRLSERRLRIDGLEVCIRNQRALDPEALQLGEDERLEHFLSYLDRRTYFWPGDTAGPVRDGQRMIDAHGDDLPAAIIRIPTRSLIDANLPRVLCVAAVNTGAAWHGGGRSARQLRSAVVQLADFAGDLRLIVECSFDGAAALPAPTEVAPPALIDWRQLR